MFKPLNPGLYNLLVREFGEVRVVAEGEAMQCEYSRDSRSKLVAMARGRQEASTRQSRPKLKVISPGEEYACSCPFCSDTRQRLFINHRWAVVDEYGNKNLWLAHCWNEECLANSTRQQQLWDRVFRNGRRPPSCDEVRHGEEPDPEDLGKAVPPGPVISLEELQRQSPQHQALEYLASRGFDCQRLSRYYGVGWCNSSRYSLAEKRIYVPIVLDGELRGWQMRMPRDWEPGDPPKYWSMPNMKRRALAYNYDKAVEYRMPVIVEGPADVWGFGPQSMGCIGKSMSLPLVRRLVAAVCRVSRQERPVLAVMLDPEPDHKAAAKPNYVHHIEKLALSLESTKAVDVIRVYLPLGTDPGSLNREYLRDYITECGREQGLKVSFKKRRI